MTKHYFANNTGINTIFYLPDRMSAVFDLNNFMRMNQLPNRRLYWDSNPLWVMLC